MAQFRPKLTPSGQALLNLGCGWKMHPAWTNLDFPPYARLVRHPHLVRLLDRCGLITEVRRQRLAGIDPDIICWDLRKGIPFPEATFHAVYHSHFLEHLDRDAAPRLAKECFRVLKSGGILRVVVPDWHHLTQAYLCAWTACENHAPDARRLHSSAMNDLIEQMVRTHGAGAPRNAMADRHERWFRGDASRIGELHRWMYDAHSLAWLLADTGFLDTRVESSTSSRIPEWAGYRLDVNEDGSAYKPESLYMEALKG